MAEQQHRPRHVCNRWPEPSAPVSLSRPTMIIIPKSKPAAQSKSAAAVSGLQAIVSGLVA